MGTLATCCCQCRRGHVRRQGPGWESTGFLQPAHDGGVDGAPAGGGGPAPCHRARRAAPALSAHHGCADGGRVVGGGARRGGGRVSPVFYAGSGKEGGLSGPGGEGVEGGAAAAPRRWLDAGW